MGFCVREKGFGYSEAYLYKKSNEAGRGESATAKSYFQQLHESSSVKYTSTGQTSAMELYERMRRFQAVAEEEMPELDASAEGNEQTAETIAEKAMAKDAESESASTRKDGQEEEDSKTDTEVIVKPDGSRVLVLTMNVGGIETSMTLEISKPTAMPNGNRAEGGARPEQTENPHGNLEILDALEKE